MIFTICTLIHIPIDFYPCKVLFSRRIFLLISHTIKITVCRQVISFAQICVFCTNICILQQIHMYLAQNYDIYTFTYLHFFQLSETHFICYYWNIFVQRVSRKNTFYSKYNKIYIYTEKKEFFFLHFKIISRNFTSLII